MSKDWNLDKLSFNYWETQILNLAIKHYKSLNTGQMQHTHLIGNKIVELLKRKDIKNILEIGSWNGRGSTVCFYLGLLINKRHDVTIFSTEINNTRYNEALGIWKDHQNVRLLNGYIDENTPTPEDILIKFPNAVKEWLIDDLDNMKNKKCVYNVLPKIDLVLLDGSEYLTYYEYLFLKDKVNYILCDDSNVDKCREIKHELLTSNEWICLFQSNERNGTCGFERK